MMSKTILSEKVLKVKAMSLLRSGIARSPRELWEKATHYNSHISPITMATTLFRE